MSGRPSASPVALPRSPLSPRQFRLVFVGLILTVLLVALDQISWGGTTYEWDSPVVLGLAAFLVVTAAVLVIMEKRTVDPVLPLSLFRNRNFVLATLIGVTTGIFTFATISYIPTFLQMLDGVSATKSGLMMIPMTAGMLISALATGGWISRTGRYKVFILIGLIIVLAGLLMLPQLSMTTPYRFTAFALFITGLGVGFFMQNLTVIVQNGASREDIGTATSTTNYFRQIGASFGIAVFGSIFVSRLTDALGSSLPAGVAPTGGETGISSLTPELLAAMSPQAKDLIARGFAEALPPIFWLGIPIVLVGLLMAVFLKETPLSTTFSPVPGADEPQAPITIQVNTP